MGYRIEFKLAGIRDWNGLTGAVAAVVRKASKVRFTKHALLRIMVIDKPKKPKN